MIPRCDLKAHSECHCQSISSCVAQPKTVAPVIRFSPRTIIFISSLFGLAVFICVSALSLAAADEAFHQQDLIAQESTHHG